MKIIKKMSGFTDDIIKWKNKQEKYCSKKILDLINNENKEQK